MFLLEELLLDISYPQCRAAKLDHCKKITENDQEQKKGSLLCALTFNQISHVIQNPFHLFSIVAMVAYFTSVTTVMSRNTTGSRV